jgi:protein TonB
MICIGSVSSIKADDMQDITYVDVVKRKGLFYEVFSTTPHTGLVVGLYKSGEMREKGNTDKGKKTGIWNIYDDSRYDNKIIRTDTYLNGKKNGKSIEYFTNCNPYRNRDCIKFISNYKDDFLNGTWETFNSSGQLTTTGNYSDGLKEGEWIVYNSNSRPVEQGSYSFDLKDGVWFYFNNEILFEAKTYKSDKLEGLQTKYYANGELKESKIISNNSLTLHETYDKFGLVVTSLTFSDGKKSGTELIFYPNGQLEGVRSWQDGKKNGLWEFFDMAGNLEKSEIFSNNQIKEILFYNTSGALREKRVVEIDNSEIWYEYLPNGKIKKSKAILINGSIQEKRYVYNPISGEQYVVEGEEKDGKREGLWKFYDLEGSLISKGYYNNDMKDGTWEEYYITNPNQDNIDRNNLTWEDKILMFSNKPTNQIQEQISEANDNPLEEISSPQLNRSSDFTNTINNEYLPIVKVAPIYPNRALSRGIEGWCIVEYTVTKNGTTANGKVVECTSSLFASASLKAAAKFKYKPRVINGTPIDVPGVQHKVTYALEN